MSASLHNREDSSSNIIIHRLMMLILSTCSFMCLVHIVSVGLFVCASRRTDIKHHHDIRPE